MLLFGNVSVVGMDELVPIIKRMNPRVNFRIVTFEVFSPIRITSGFKEGEER